MIKKSVLLSALAIAGFAVTSLAQTVPNYVPTNGLVGWWPFNGNAIDESVNTNDGTVNGATLTADRFGSANSAYSFDGVSNFISCSAISISGQTQRSISFWYNENGSSVNGNSAVSWGPNISGQRFDCGFNFQNQGVFVGAAFSSKGFSLNQAITQWNHYVVLLPSIVNPTVDDIIVYQNGIQLNNVTVNYNITTIVNTASGYPLLFGKNTTVNFPAFLNGKLDDIGIWNRALTQQEITGLYNGNLCFQTITVTDTLLINTNFTGFNPITYQNTIKIWPNPTNDHITIDNGNLANLTGHQIKISNALGQQVFQSAITQQQFYVDMSTWGGNGIYFVNLINAQGVTIETRKIMLQ
jgi:hypothetical protein